MLTTIYIASYFIDTFTIDKNGYRFFHPIEFIIPTDDRDKVVDKYIKALDLIQVLNYKNSSLAWEKLKSKHNIKIDYSITLQGEGDTSIEDFLTLKQAAQIIENSPRLGSREKINLLCFLSDSLRW